MTFRVLWAVDLVVALECALSFFLLLIVAKPDWK